MAKYNDLLEAQKAIINALWEADKTQIEKKPFRWDALSLPSQK